MGDRSVPAKDFVVAPIWHKIESSGASIISLGFYGLYIQQSAIKTYLDLRYMDIRRVIKLMDTRLETVDFRVFRDL